jgi:hypothetical protein
MSDEEWTDINGRPLSDYSPKELLDRDLCSTALFLKYICNYHYDVIHDWIHDHPNSDFVRWLRSFEYTGL